MSEEKKQKAGKRAAKPTAGKSPDQGGKKPKEKAAGTAPRTGSAQILHILYIVLTVVSAVIVVGYIFWRIFAAPPSVDHPNDPDRPGATRPPVVITTTDPITGEQIEVEIPALSGDRKKEFYTFLMVGVSQDTGGGLTDTMMLAAYDVPNQKLSVMSLPRDIYVAYDQLLNSVYVYGGGAKDGKGIEALKKEVQKLTGVYPDFHAVVQWEALGELVDAIGGVEFEVPFDMYYNDLSQHFKINLKKGKQVLDGNGAMGLVRWRQNSDDYAHIDYTYGYREGDIGRIKTQQAFLKEVIKKCLQPGVILDNWTEYLAIFQRNVVTNLSTGEMAYFAQSAVGGLKMDNVEFATLPYFSAGNGHLLPSGRQIVSTVNASFNPYEEDIHLGELKLATMDAVPVKPSESPDPEEIDTDGDGIPDSEDDDVDGDGIPNEEDPDYIPPPKESGRPDASPAPNEGDPVLPPGVLVRPGSSPRPTQSADPSGSPRPSAPAEPSGSPRPAESGRPGGLIRPGESASPSPSPTETVTSGPEAGPKPSEGNETTAAPKPAESSEPVPTAPDKPTEPEPTPFAIPGGPSPEEPLLPPGV